MFPTQRLEICLIKIYIALAINITIKIIYISKYYLAAPFFFFFCSICWNRNLVKIWPVWRWEEITLDISPVLFVIQKWYLSPFFSTPRKLHAHTEMIFCTIFSAPRQIQCKNQSQYFVKNHKSYVEIVGKGFWSSRFARSKFIFL